MVVQGATCPNCNGHNVLEYSWLLHWFCGDCGYSGIPKVLPITAGGSSAPVPFVAMDKAEAWKQEQDWARGLVDNWKPHQRKLVYQYLNRGYNIRMDSIDFDIEREFNADWKKNNG